MADRKGTLPDSLIQPLLRSGGLRRVDSRAAEQAAARNDAWEDRLRRLPDGYLRDYDLLFRQVTRYLLAQGLDVGQHHPHRTLATILSLLGRATTKDIETMIRHRHALKYDPTTPQDEAARDVLQRFLTGFREEADP